MTQRRPALSIVVPSFNHGEFIEDTLASLFAQRGLEKGELEIIVVDGGSSDQTVAILKRLDRKIAYWVSEPDEGQTAALIKGFERATGEILGWLCSDDMLEPWTSREVIDVFRANPDAQFVYGDGAWIDREGRALKSKNEIPFNWFIWLHDHNYIPQPAAFWRSELYHRAGGLDREFHVAMDGDLFARFASVTKPVHVSRHWARMRSYPDQKNKRLRAQSDQEDRLVRQRLGVSYENTLTVHMRYAAAKMLRVGWKVCAGVYFR